MPEKKKKKYITHNKFSSRGGIARAKKYTKEQLSEMGKKGGRPRKHAKQNTIKA